MTSTASNMRLMRSGASGQYCADDVLVERVARADAEPVRPGWSAAEVAVACATTAGCMRNVGVVTPGPRSPVVRAPIAASTLHTNDDSPCEGTHGWKWSLAIVPRKPCASASAAYSTASAGGKRSSIAAYPMWAGTRPSSPPR